MPLPSAVNSETASLLTSFEIENFRGFKSLTLDGLQRVNLIAGKNNSGKTSLLEALLTWCDPQQATTSIKHLRQLEEDVAGRFASGHFASWLLTDEPGISAVTLTGRTSSGKRSERLTIDSKNSDLLTIDQQFLQSQFPNRMFEDSPRPSPDLKAGVIPVNQRSPKSLVLHLGNALRRQGAEELIEGVLNAVDHRIKKLRVLPLPHGPQIVVDIGLSRLAPASQVGQGIYRLIEILSEIIGSESQIAIIDEIENGIHHSCLIDMWRGLAEAAAAFNVQIFATTHSEECIEAAHRAFTEADEYTLAVIQLFRDSDRSRGRVLDRDLIQAAISGDIDLRA